MGWISLLTAGSETGLRKTTAIEGQRGGVAEAASLLGLSNDLVTFFVQSRPM